MLAPYPYLETNTLTNGYTMDLIVSGGGFYKLTFDGHKSVCKIVSVEAFFKQGVVMSKMTLEQARELIRKENEAKRAERIAELVQTVESTTEYSHGDKTDEVVFLENEAIIEEKTGVAINAHEEGVRLGKEKTRQRVIEAIAEIERITASLENQVLVTDARIKGFRKKVLKYRAYSNYLASKNLDDVKPVVDVIRPINDMIASLKEYFADERNTAVVKELGGKSVVNGIMKSAYAYERALKAKALKDAAKAA